MSKCKYIKPVNLSCGAVIIASVIFSGCDPSGQIIREPAEECVAEDKIKGSAIIQERNKTVDELLSSVTNSFVTQVGWSGLVAGGETDIHLNIKGIGDKLTSEECDIHVNQKVTLFFDAPGIMKGTLEGEMQINRGENYWLIGGDSQDSTWGGIKRDMIQGLKANEKIQGYGINARVGINGEIEQVGISVSVESSNKDEAGADSSVSSRRLVLGSS